MEVNTQCHDNAYSSMIHDHNVYTSFIVEGPRVIPDSAQPTGILAPSPSTKWSIIFDQVVSEHGFMQYFLLGEERPIM